ncbi:hypothetical protein C7212DRAFT_314394 [Tuber magnatum]|uniref:Uncharacterized protein n=1 Tax=Tuber magnatum TaxID=42249 RepID=A0A317SV92_9PEZI|nr:hypothetical protein C7212DRAFT_314394 [Tuber magnatum]
MNRRSGERERTELLFLPYLCFSGYEKEATWPLVFAFRDLIEFCSANSKENYPPSPFVLPPGCLPSPAGSKFASRAIIIPCRGKKKLKEKDSLTPFFDQAIVALTSPNAIGHLLCCSGLRNWSALRPSCRYDITILSDSTGPEANLTGDSDKEHLESKPIHQAHLTPLEKTKTIVDRPCAALPVLAFPSSGISIPGLNWTGRISTPLPARAFTSPPYGSGFGFIEFLVWSAGKWIVLTITQYCST